MPTPILYSNQLTTFLVTWSAVHLRDVECVSLRVLQAHTIDCRAFN